MHYVSSGANIFSPTCIDEDIDFHVKLGTNKYMLKVKRVSSFNLDMESI